MDFTVAENAIGWIEANPKQHDQSMWAIENECGTTMCLAGVIAVQAGAKMVFPEGYARTVQCVTADGVQRLIPEYAAEVLGVRPWGKIQDTLFNASNTLDDIKMTIKDVANGELIDGEDIDD